MPYFSAQTKRPDTKRTALCIWTLFLETPRKRVQIQSAVCFVSGRFFGPLMDELGRTGRAGMSWDELGRAGANDLRLSFLYIQTPDQPPLRPDVIMVAEALNLII